MKKDTCVKSARVEELKQMLADYERMTIEEVEATGWGDRQIEIENEVWRLEMELIGNGFRRSHAA